MRYFANPHGSNRKPLEHVNALFARLIFTKDVVAALEADDSLSPALRRSAVTKARAMGDEPIMRLRAGNIRHFPSKRPITPLH